jgi:hypothetical protein
MEHFHSTHYGAGDAQSAMLDDEANQAANDTAGPAYASFKLKKVVERRRLLSEGEDIFLPSSVRKPI